MSDSAIHFDQHSPHPETSMSKDEDRLFEVSLIVQHNHQNDTTIVRGIAVANCEADAIGEVLGAHGRGIIIASQVKDLGTSRVAGLATMGSYTQKQLDEFRRGDMWKFV
jgi:hypothetical protein